MGSAVTKPPQTQVVGMPGWLLVAISLISAVAALALQAWETRLGGSILRTLDLGSVGLEHIANSPVTVGWLIYYTLLALALSLSVSGVVLIALSEKVLPQRSWRGRVLALLGLALFVQISLQALAAWLYPTLPTVEFARLVMGTPMGLALFAAGLLLFGVCIIVTIARGVRRAPRLSAAMVLVSLVLSLPWHGERPASAPSAKPNVILIGLDSFRPDLMFLEDGQADQSPTPSIRAMVAGSHYLPDATTPFPRTYPATVSVMTGRWPHRHGARENLYGQQRVSLQETLGSRLAEAGYETVFGMDEVRFANITQAYGYERLISPRDGIVDFIAEAAASAAPLALLANAPVMQRVAPHLYGNRALTAIYSPNAFVRRVRGALAERDGRPLFLHLHLTLPHWPYRPEGAEGAAARWKSLADEGFRPSYLRALEELDSQFAEIIDELRTDGLLENAIIFLYSDHGQSFALARDAFTSPNGSTGEFDGYGHGSSIVSRGQVDVLLAFQRFRNGSPDLLPMRDLEIAASLVDIPPTILDLVGEAPALGMDGRSTALLSPEDRASIRNRGRVYEGPFPLMSVNSPRVDVGSVVREAAGRFQVSASGDRIEFRSSAIPGLLEAKHRAVEIDGWVLLRYRVGGKDVRDVLVHRPTRRVWPGAPFPPDAPYRALSGMWCSAWQDQVAWIDATCHPLKTADR